MFRAVHFVALFSVACGWRVSDEAGLARLEQKVAAGSDGALTVVVPVGEEDALMFTAIADAGDVQLDILTAPDGTVVVHGDELRVRPFNLTNAIFPSGETTLVWPIRLADRPLEPGEWTFTLAASEGGVGVNLVAHLRSDVDPSVLPVQLVVDDVLMDDPVFVTVLDGALVRWDELMDQVGVTLDLVIESRDLGLPAPPGRGDSALWTEVSASAPGRLVVAMVEQFDGSEDLAGVAGDIPGPREPTGRSAVAVASAFAAGPDGLFTVEARRILGETLAHEAMHYLGLYHPVESDWSTYDSLPDTPVCVDSEQCASALSQNLMFPFPICGRGFCLPQGSLTHHQGGVIRGWVGVRAR